MKTLKVTILLVCLIALVGCGDNSTDPGPVVDYGSIAFFHITNQSTTDLKVTFKIKYNKADSTVTVPADSTTKIYRMGGLGGRFPPSTAFIKLRFYKRSAQDLKNPMLVIKPIENDNWDREQGDIGIDYTLVITEEDLP